MKSFWSAFHIEIKYTYANALESVKKRRYKLGRKVVVNYNASQIDILSHTIIKHISLTMLVF